MTTLQAVNIADVYARFFALGGAPKGSKRPWHYRRQCTSMRLAGCELLASLVRTRRPARVLDLGSGMTTHVLRALMAEDPKMVVVTTDTAPLWLARTMAELHRDGLSEAHCYTQGDFEATDWEPFDLISVDCGDTGTRIKMAVQIADWCAPRGILVMDDWRLGEYPLRMTTCLTALGFRVTEHPETMDQYDNMLATAERAR